MKECVEHDLLGYWDSNLKLDGASWCTACGKHWGHRKERDPGPASLVRASGWLIRMRKNGTLQVRTAETMTAEQAREMASALLRAHKVAREMLSRAAGRDTGARYFDVARQILWGWHDQNLMEGCKITNITPRVAVDCCRCREPIVPGSACWRPTALSLEEARELRRESGVHLMTHTTSTKARFCTGCVADAARVSVTAGVAKPRALRLA